MTSSKEIRKHPSPSVVTRAAMFSTDDVQALAGQLQGKIVRPGDVAYEAARCVHVASDAMPALIVCCAATSDVVAAVRFARAHNLDAAVRSGGHSIAGYGIVDGGLVIDLSPMKTIEVSADAQTARIGAGLTWEEVARALHPPRVLARLSALKRQWDPTNFFRHNLSITPAAG